MSISLCCNFFDETTNVRAVFNCVADIVDEIVVVDTGSTDGTQELCRKLGARVYQINGVPGYGQMRTLTLHLARTDWALILDGDERMDKQDVYKLKTLSQTKMDHDLIMLPRQHYRAWDRSICENPDIKVYADWQPRFIRVKTSIYWVRRVHEQIRGVGKVLQDLNNPVIRHFGWLKTPERLQMIVDMCNRLYEEDKKEGIAHPLAEKAGAITGEAYWAAREDEAIQKESKKQEEAQTDKEEKGVDQMPPCRFI